MSIKSFSLQKTPPAEIVKAKNCRIEYIAREASKNENA